MMGIRMRMRLITYLTNEDHSLRKRSKAKPGFPGKARGGYAFLRTRGGIK